VESIEAVFPDLEWFGHWQERSDGFVMKNTGHSGTAKVILGKILKIL
jgi:hypothetical protein